MFSRQLSKFIILGLASNTERSIYVATYLFVVFVDSTAQYVAAGAKSNHGFFDFTPSSPSPPPTETPPPTPEPPPAPEPVPGGTGTGGLDPNGVMKIYPGVAGTEWYMNMALSTAESDAKFGYDGINCGVTSTRHTGGSGGNPAVYYTASSSTLSYASGGSGKTLRINVYAGGGKGSSQTHTWKEKPDFLYNSSGIRNQEYTIYVRPNSDIGLSKHHSCAAKMSGGKDDNGRSIFEVKYTTTDHSDTILGNWDYEHPVYVPVPNVSTYFTGDHFTVGKWVGLKCVHKVKADKSSSIWELWVDTNPFDSAGVIQNHWKLKGSMADHGCSQFNNIPCTWRSQTDRWRLDGFNSIDFTYMSDREIDPNASVSGNAGVDANVVQPGPAGSASSGSQMDIFGVTELYPSNTAGSSWTMPPTPVAGSNDDEVIGGLSDNDPNTDPRRLSSSNFATMTQNSDGSWKEKITEFRWVMSSVHKVLKGMAAAGENI